MDIFEKSLKEIYNNFQSLNHQIINSDTSLENLENVISSLELYDDRLKSMLDINPYHLINIKKYDSRLSISEIVRNAIDFVKTDKSYCLLTNNCEMFAEYCSTGIMPIVSKQVIDTVKKYVTGSDIISNINTFIVDGLFSLFE